MLSFNQFSSEFSHLVERLCTSHNKIIITGDFNIHCDMASNLETTRFISTNIFSDAPSDHYYIISDVHIPRPKVSKSKIQVSSRKLKDIQIESFIENIQQADFVSVVIV